MANQLVIKREKPSTPYKADIYREFILWTAMPHAEKVRLGIETQGQFVAHYKIGINTPAKWKERPDFEQRVDAILKMWATDKTPDVIHAIYRAAVKGNPMSQMLWLQYFKKFNPRADADEKQKVEIGVNDIRHLIEQLPEPLKSKHYGNLRDLLIDASAIANARDVEDSNWTERPAETVRIEADNDAHNVPDKEADAVAKSYKGGLRANMVGDVLSIHHKGAERRWEK